MDNHNINYVPKDLNPTAVPQFRQIEDIFSILGTCVYAKNWVAKDEGLSNAGYGHALKNPCSNCTSNHNGHQKEAAQSLLHWDNEC